MVSTCPVYDELVQRLDDAAVECAVADVTNESLCELLDEANRRLAALEPPE